MHLASRSGTPRCRQIQIADHVVLAGIKSRTSAANQNGSGQQLIAGDARSLWNEHAIRTRAAPVIADALGSAAQAGRLQHMLENLIANIGVAPIPPHGREVPKIHCRAAPIDQEREVRNEKVFAERPEIEAGHRRTRVDQVM